MNPYDAYIEKDGRQIKKTALLYVDGETKLCDGCDEKKAHVASIKTISGGVECICLDCIKDIYDAVKEASENTEDGE